MLRTKAILTMTAALLVAAPAAVAGEAAVAVTDGATPEVIRFDTSTPATLTGRTPIVGLAFGEQIEAIDQRPSSGQLVAITTLNRMVVIDPATGATTFDGAPIDPTVIVGPGVGSDFNPTVDRLRLIDASDHNARWNPVSLALITPADTALNYPVADPHSGANPAIADLAYTNNDNDGATLTTVFGIDTDLNLLVRLGSDNGSPTSPNAGQLATIGPLGVDPDDAAFDVATVGTTNVAYAVLHLPAATTSRLSTINLATGAATLVGVIGGGAKVDGFTILRGGSLRVAPATVAESGTASVAVTRTGNVLAPVSVGYRTVGRTAQPGSDYTDVAGTLAFAQGQKTATIAVPVRADTLDEPDETFSVELGTPVGGAVVDTPSTPIAIHGDDAKPVFLAAPTAPDTLRALRSAGSLKGSFSCSEACAVSFSLRLGAKTIGTAKVARTSRGVGKLSVRLSSAGKKAVAKAAKTRGKTTLTLRATVRDTAGNTVTSRTKLSVRRR